MSGQFKNSIFLAVLVAILIFFLSIMPADVHGKPPAFYFEGLDKIIHASMYGVLAFLVLRAYLKRYELKIFWLVLLLVLTFSYSILMELLQYYFVEYRTGDILDALANLAGITLAAVLILIMRKIRY